MTPADDEQLKKQNAMALRAITRLKQQLAAVEQERDTLKRRLEAMQPAQQAAEQVAS